MILDPDARRRRFSPLHRRLLSMFGCLTVILVAAIEIPLTVPSFAASDKADVASQVKVIDGDTISIGITRYRLHGIDAPEKRQFCAIGTRPVACGALATEALNSLIAGRPPQCRTVDTDRYGRSVAVCRIGNIDIARWMVQRGYALADRRYSSQYLDDEKAAANARLGIWSMKFTAPWIWRQQQASDKS